MAKTVVMTVSENMQISAAFFRADIWTLHNMLIGIAMTVNIRCQLFRKIGKGSTYLCSQSQRPQRN